MTELLVESDSPEMTRAIGRVVGQALPPGARLGLIGPLGAGKTCFVQGLAAGLECADTVHSPSYVLVHEYAGRCPLFHCDWYRLETEADVESTGFEDLLRPDAVVVVEWSDKHPGWLGEPRLEIAFESLDESRRRIVAREVGAGSFPEVLQALAAQFAPAPIGSVCH